MEQILVYDLPLILVGLPQLLNSGRKKLLDCWALSVADGHDETSPMFIFDAPCSQPPIIAVFPKCFPNDPMGFSTGYLFMHH